MEILLSAVPDVLGIYGTGKNGIPAGDYFPPRAAFLHPRAATAFQRAQELLGGRIRVSDMLRSAEESLLAASTKKGVQPPGYSGHNFGFSIDIAVDANLMRFNLSYPKLLEVMAQAGWYCHRQDGKRGMEDWHFNHLDSPPVAGLSWSTPVEARICEMYDLSLDAMAIQTALKKLHMYAGEVDGVLGPISREGIKAFQRAWDLPKDGTPDRRTQRVLAFVSAGKKIVPAA